MVLRTRIVLLTLVPLLVSGPWFVLGLRLDGVGGAGPCFAGSQPALLQKGDSGSPPENSTTAKPKIDKPKPETKGDTLGNMG